MQLEQSQNCKTNIARQRNKGRQNRQNLADSYPPRRARGRISLPSLGFFTATGGYGSVDGAPGGTASLDTSRSSAPKGRDRFTRKGFESSLSPVFGSSAPHQHSEQHHQQRRHLAPREYQHPPVVEDYSAPEHDPARQATSLASKPGVI